MSNQPKREDWRAWLPSEWHDPGELLPRSKVLALAERLGAVVDERTLRYWEAEEIIPRPTREHVGGAERARYPWWVVDLLWIVRQYKHWKYTNEQIRRHIPAEARRLATMPPPDRARLLAPPDPLDEYIGTLLERGLPYANGPLLVPGGEPWIAPKLMGDLQVALGRIAASLGQRYGVVIVGGTVELRTVEGERFTFDAPPTDSDSTQTAGGRS